MNETMTMNTKAPPNSKESEMMVLGCSLNSSEALKMISEDLDDSDFYYSEHKIIFQALKNTFKKRRAADVHLICEDLNSKDSLKAVGGAAYITTLSQYAGTAAHTEAYIDELKNASSRRRLIDKSNEIKRRALNESGDPSSLLEEAQNEFQMLASDYGKKLPLISVHDRLNIEDEFLKIHRGKDLIGLKVSTIQEFNEKFLGLRGLKLLAAAPNIGKTALTIQIGLEVVAEQNACLAYFSLEMTEQEIFRRMLLSLSKTNFRTHVFGSGHPSDTINFSSDEFQNAKRAKDTLLGFGDRIQILDSKRCPFLDATTVINYVTQLKEKTKSDRVLVVIDYLQVWPINPNIRLISELEADKWRIGEMKKIRDALNGDPVIVISEARKPSGNGDSWGGDMSDVMGSARGTYTPDVIMLLSSLGTKELNELWKKNGMPNIAKNSNNETSKDDESVKNLLTNMGISIVRLKVPKGRDGMERFDTILQFQFRQNTFQNINWDEIKKSITGKEPKKSKNLFGE